MNKPNAVATDIETWAPRKADLSPVVREWAERKIERGRKDDPTLDFDKFAALNPAIGRIACISVAYAVRTQSGRPGIAALSFRGDERALLESFQLWVAKRRLPWVHYNGLSFDVPFILTRMRILDLPLEIPGFDDLRRFRTDPHCDLLEVWSDWDRRRALPLGVLAPLLNLPTPKSDLSGAEVGAAMARGEVERVCRYCERDVATTLNLHRRLVTHEPTILPEHMRWRDETGGWQPIDFGDEIPIPHAIAA